MRGSMIVGHTPPSTHPGDFAGPSQDILMKISDDQFDSALLRIYQDDRVLDSSGCLTYTELQREWWETGFRHADMDAALERLERAGCLRRETATGRDVVVLKAGEHRLCSMRLLFDDLQAQISQCLFRRRTSSATAPRDLSKRRREDELHVD
jgi:hypothetical protein